MNNRARQNDRAFLARIEDEFRKDPEVAGLLDEIEKIKDHLDHNKRVVRQANDPSRQAAASHLQKLHEKYELLWGDKYEEIRQRLHVASGQTHSPASLEELKLKIAMLTRRKERQTSLLKEMESNQKGSNEDTFQATYVNYQLTSLLHWEELVRKNLEQLKYEAKHEKFRVHLLDDATAAKAPSSSKAVKYMAAGASGHPLHDVGLIPIIGDQGATQSPIPMRFRPESARRSTPCLPCQTLGRCAGSTSRMPALRSSNSSSGSTISGSPFAAMRQSWGLGGV